MSATLSKGRIWGARVVSALPVLMMLFSASMKLTQNPQAVEGFAKGGWPAGALVPIGVVEVLCAVVYAVPQTAVLGAILATGYLGGAVATHVRNGDGADKLLPAILLGVFLWLGLWLRDARVRALTPVRKPELS